MIRFLKFCVYCAWVFWEVLLGTKDVVVNLFKPGTYGKPMIVELPLRCETDMEITLMASSITITPGTLVVASAAGTEKTLPTLFVHSLFSDTEDEALEGLYDMESRLLHAWRGTRELGPIPRPAVVEPGSTATEASTGATPDVAPGATREAGDASDIETITEPDPAEPPEPGKEGDPS